MRPDSPTLTRLGAARRALKIRSPRMPASSTRRTFVKQASLLLAGAYASPWPRLAAADGANVTATTSAGSVRGTLVEGINIFKGVPYGATTAGKNRFMPPAKPAPWTGTRDALAYGPTAPQAGSGRRGVPPDGEDCLVLNVF